MKIGVEDAIILRPGTIVGDSVDQKILGQAAVNAARIARKDKTPSKYWVLEQAEIIKYGRDEWKDRSIRQSGTEL
ncbi:hypothetical protein GGP41_001440 [Bipolaris sorokiniana]|uniref:Uncharacterized protein n=1 Tax=Cochliobolus sativus TaxID=45130 RepID=A0A8H6DQ98_COCSA|nr:hypothetical protein GGP41_001440 [Bipolaris sorokiniana]